MKNIRYYDRINKKYINLEVSDEVAKFLHSNSKSQQRQTKKDSKHIAVYLDEKIDSGKINSLTYNEIIADESQNIEKEVFQTEFTKIVWSVVDKLQKTQRDIIKDIYLNNLRPSEVAKKYNKTRSELTQYVDTIKKHLRYLLVHDSDFIKTTYFKRLQQENVKDFMDVAKEIAEDDNYKFDLNAIFNFSKALTQGLKIADKLDIPPEDSEKDLLKEMIKTVNDFLKPLLK